MESPKTIEDWLEQALQTPAPKFITGLRGSGKANFLHRIRQELLAQGVPPERILFLDTEDPALRRYATHVQMLDYVADQLPREGLSYILIREATELPMPEIVVGALAATSRFSVFATSSSRLLLRRGLKDYFSGQILHVKLLPAERSEPYPMLEARARWNEIFLYDVIATNTILEFPIINQLACWLSDNLGAPVSLRQVACAISPSARLLSPHTIEAYLTALEDAHLVEKSARWDTAERAPQKTNYRYFFTDPWLRLAHFGPAPEDEDRRMALNRAWLHLRRTRGRTYVASGTPGLDFVTESGLETLGWTVTPAGELVQAAIDPPRT